jgi:hypothetical protein
MNNLKLHYSVERKDIEVEDKKIVLKYFNIIKKHKNLDLRINDINPNKKLLSINAISINKIFSYLGNELPEEFILFLYDKTGKDSNDYGYIINTGKQKEQEDMDEEKKEFLTLEIENPVLKKYRTLTYQIMKKYYFIFCIISFIIAILFTLHLFSYLIDKEVS